MGSEIVYVDADLSGSVKKEIAAFMVYFDEYNEVEKKCEIIVKELKRVIAADPNIKLKLAENKITII